MRRPGSPRSPGCATWTSGGDRAHLRSADPDATVMALAQAGAVRNLEVTPADLEDAFVALTTEDAPIAEETM